MKPLIAIRNIIFILAMPLITILVMWKEDEGCMKKVFTCKHDLLAELKKELK